jgi:hypothetical protein
LKVPMPILNDGGTRHYSPDLPWSLALKLQWYLLAQREKRCSPRWWTQLLHLIRVNKNILVEYNEKNPNYYFNSDPCQDNSLN